MGLVKLRIPREKSNRVLLLNLDHNPVVGWSRFMDPKLIFRGVVRQLGLLGLSWSHSRFLE